VRANVSRGATVSRLIREARETEGSREGAFDRPSARSRRRETDALDVPLAAVPGVKRAHGTRRRPRRDATRQTAEALEARPRASADSRAADERTRRERAARHERRAQRHGTDLTARFHRCRAEWLASQTRGRETPTRRGAISVRFIIAHVGSGKPLGLILSQARHPVFTSETAAAVRRRHSSVSSFPSIGTPVGAATQGPGHGEEEEEEPSDGQEV
jgi:hypothetical protein